jgi:hypothetical protein
MEVLKLTARIDQTGHLNLSIPTQLEAVEVDVVVVLTPVSSDENPQPRYDFSDLAGRLTWQGDAIVC